MLIWLDESVLNADLSIDIDACHGIGAIFDSVFRGEHYAMSSRKTLSVLAQSPCLSAATKAVISTIYSNFSTIGAISEIVATRLHITHVGCTEPVRKTSHIWEIPLRYVGVNGLRKSVLLAENLNHARAFEHAAQQYQAFSQIRGRICLEKILGGGSTTPDVLKNLVESEKRLCLCITDSDRFCPNDDMDLTAKKCRKIAMEKASIADHIDLKVREIENAIPLTLLGEAVPPTHQKQWDWHIDRLIALCPEAHQYCDMKFGTTRRKIHSYSNGSQRKIFWESVAKTLTNAAALKPDHHEGECQKAPDEHCECYVTYGFGENLLSTMLEYLDSKSPHDSEKRTRNDPLRELWMEIGKCVYEWTCAPKPMRS